MRPFIHSTAGTTTTAIQHARAVDHAAQTNGATPIAAPAQFHAGGTNLLDLMVLDVMRPSHLVDINPLGAGPMASRIVAKEYGLRIGTAAELGVDPGQVRVRSPFIGGAFGSKGAVTPRTAIKAVAAKRLGRPVKLVTTRPQGFTIVTYRAETRHQVNLGASRDGHLVALSHKGWEVTSRADDYAVAGTDDTTRMYACPNIASVVNIVNAGRNTPGFMRASAEVPYKFAWTSWPRSSRWILSNCGASTTRCAK